MNSTPFKAIVFDMDGVLIDSEPLWHEAEIAAFGRHGLVLSAADCAQTTGVRIDHVVRHWRTRHPDVLAGVSDDVLVENIVAGVVARILERGVAVDGAVAAVQQAHDAGLRLGLASSSPPAVIDAVLTRLQVRACFLDVRSGWLLATPKPHPQIYLDACVALDVDVGAAIAVEDSESGLRAAIAAGLFVCALPDVRVPIPPSAARAHVVLPSLQDLATVYAPR